jgi:hypothetical protein
VKSDNYMATKATEIRLARRSPTYWQVTFDHPPLNIFGPETIPQLNEIITALETDEHVKVVVFDSAVEGFFLTHYNFLARLEDLTGLPPGPTGLQPLPDMLVRLSRAPVVSIAFDSGASHWCRQRACTCQRHAFCESRKSHPVAVGSGCWSGTWRRTHGATAAAHGKGTRLGSASRRGRHSRRLSRALRLCESVVTGC